MTKTRYLLIILLVTSLVSFGPLSVREGRGETRIVITFAAGGAIGGAYFFLRFVFSSSALAPAASPEDQALFNYGTGGWRVSLPVLSPLPHHAYGPLPPGALPPQLAGEIIRIRF
jgi:hypothetical protein